MPSFDFGPFFYNSFRIAHFLGINNLILYEFCSQLYEKFIKVKSGDVVVDIGASVGIFSVPVADREPEAKFYCVEPSPSCMIILIKNASHLCNIEFINKGIYFSNVTKVLDGVIYDVGFDKVEKVPVELITIRDLFEDYDLRPDFLKVDCEGSEYHIFTKDNLDIILSIPHIATEFHIESVEQEILFRDFRDNILPYFPRFEIYDWKGEVNLRSKMYEDNFTIDYDNILVYIFN